MQSSKLHRRGWFDCRPSFTKANFEFLNGKSPSGRTKFIQALDMNVGRSENSELVGSKFINMNLCFQLKLGDFLYFAEFAILFV